MTAGADAGLGTAGDGEEGKEEAETDGGLSGRAEWGGPWPGAGCQDSAS